MQSTGGRWTARHSDLLALLVSATAAALAPLPTFLLAYVVLGPIHYLTEIRWLRQKDFYFKQGLIPGWMYGAGAALLAILGASDYVLKRGFSNWLVPGLLLLSVSACLRNRYALGAAAVAALAVHHFSPQTIFLVAAFTPSLVHVFVFTWFFMMSGALRSGSAGTPWRWLNPALLLALPLILLWLPMHYPAQNALWLRMDGESFEPMHRYIMLRLHHSFALGPTMLDDPLAAGMLRIFAFIYLFHYLNWFGKASLLQWHRIPKTHWAVIGTISAGSVALYAWNFRLGFLVTNFLGLLHVLLEFPLDWQAMRLVLVQRGRSQHAMETPSQPRLDPAPGGATAG